MDAAGQKVIETPPGTPPELIGNMGRIAKLSAEERKELAKKGGKATAGISKMPYVYCDACQSNSECGHYNKGKKCHLQVEFRKRFKKNPVSAFEMLGLENPKNFARMVTNLLMETHGRVIEENNPDLWLKYIDRMLAFGKLLYGEKHFVFGNMQHETRTLNIEKILLERRKKTAFDPMKKEKVKSEIYATPSG